MYDSRVEYLYFGCLNRWTLGKYLKILLTYHPVLLDNTFRLIIDHMQKLKLLNQILKELDLKYAVDMWQTLYIKPFELRNQASPPGCVTIGLQPYRLIGLQSHLTKFARQQRIRT